MYKTSRFNKIIFHSILFIYLSYHYIRKERFAEGFKILLNTDLKMILAHQNNFIKTLKIMNNAAKSFDILAIDAFSLIMLIV